MTPLTLTATMGMDLIRSLKVAMPEAGNSSFGFLTS